MCGLRNNQEGCVIELLCMKWVVERFACVRPLGFMLKGGAEVLPMPLKIMSVSLVQTFKTWQCLHFLKLKI